MKSTAQCQFDKPQAIILSHQRSGTHFLEASLSSHPFIHKRSECVLRYKLYATDSALADGYMKKHIFVNDPRRFNIAIVMYSEVELYESLCGPLSEQRIIHLLRNPAAVARSMLQREANKSRYGDSYKAHYKLDETAPANVPFDSDKIAALQSTIESDQKRYSKLLRTHPCTLTVDYDDMTANAQVNMLPQKLSATLLRFLQLPHHPLSNKLRKVGVPASPHTP